MIRFLGRSRLWLEVVGHRFGEVAQWERLEGGSRCGNVLGGWGVGAIEQGGGRDTEKRGGGTGEGVLESGELVAPPFAYTGSGVSLGHPAREAISMRPAKTIPWVTSVPTL